MNQPAEKFQIVDSESDEPTLKVIEHNAIQKADEGMTKAEQMLATAKNLQINTPADAQTATEMAKEIKVYQDQVDAERRKFTDPLNSVIKHTNDRFRPALTASKDAIALLRKKVTDHNLKMEKIAREEQAKRDEQARRQREKLEAQAAAAAEKGQTEKAEAIAERAETISAPTVVPVAPKGASVRKAWKGKVTDIKALCKAIGDGLTPPTLVIADQKALDSMAKATKGSMEIPGVQFSQVASTTFR